MTDRFLNDLFRWFDDYTRPYLAGESGEAKACVLKVRHTLNVVREMDDLLEAVDLPAPDRRTARAIALLHDLGRFEQMARHGTFSDRHSVDHATLGVEEIARTRVLAELPATERHLIEQAVHAHNKLAIPEGYTDRERLFSRLIRDADKLDILRVFVEQDGSDDEEQRAKAYLDIAESDRVSAEVIADFDARRMVRIEFCRSRPDFRLMMLSWVFDFNYSHSLRRVAERNVPASLFARIPDSEGVRRARAVVDDLLTHPSRAPQVRKAS